jgi:excisionase family DNA binding protein
MSLGTQSVTSLSAESESQLAREGARVLAASIGVAPAVRLRITGGNVDIVVPAKALGLLVDILAHMGEGRSVTVLPIREELTTQQAANLLRVSRPHLVTMLERRELPFRKVGKHRRVFLQDVLKYQQESRRKQEAALDALASQAQELEMGY